MEQIYCSGQIISGKRFFAVEIWIKVVLDFRQHFLPDKSCPKRFLEFDIENRNKHSLVWEKNLKTGKRKLNIAKSPRDAACCCWLLQAEAKPCMCCFSFSVCYSCANLYMLNWFLFVFSLSWVISLCYCKHSFWIMQILIS